MVRLQLNGLTEDQPIVGVIEEEGYYGRIVTEYASFPLHHPRRRLALILNLFLCPFTFLCRVGPLEGSKGSSPKKKEEVKG